ERRERRLQRGAGGPAQPQAGVALDVRLGDRDLDPVLRNDRGERRERALGDLLERQRRVLPLLVREQAVFLRVVRAARVREAEDRLLAEDLDLARRQRGLEAIRDAVVEGAEADRVAAVHLEAQLVVA